MALTEVEIKKAQPADRIYKLTDGRGLFVQVRPTGVKMFVKEYRFAGKRRSDSLGIYPALKLAEARSESERIKTLVKAGYDPRPEKILAPEQAEAAMNAEVPEERKWRTLCDQFIEKRVKEGIAEATRLKLVWNLGATCDEFGDFFVAKITPPEILALIERVQETGKYEKARDMHRKMSQVFQYAAARGLILHDPAHTIRGALVRRKSQKHPGLTEPADVGALVRGRRGFQGDAATRAGLLISAYCFLRSTELRGALWSEIDLEARMWTVPAERMKKGYGKHQIPLSTQAVGVFEWLRCWTRDRPYVFCSNMYKDRHLSNATGTSDEGTFAVAKKATPPELETEASSTNIRNITGAFLDTDDEDARQQQRQRAGRSGPPQRRQAARDQGRRRPRPSCRLNRLMDRRS